MHFHLLFHQLHLAHVHEEPLFLRSSVMRRRVDVELGVINERVFEIIRVVGRTPFHLSND
jgi:hypothetical protein